MTSSVDGFTQAAQAEYLKRNFKESEKFLRRALEIDSNDPKAITYLGAVLYEMNDYEAALPFLLRAPFHILDARSSAIIRRRLGISQVSLGYDREAIENFSLMFACDASQMAEMTEQYVQDAEACAPAAVLGSKIPTDLQNKSTKEVFTYIYQNDIWGGGSGGGSNIDRSAVYVGYVQHLIRKYRPAFILDIGCGDWRFSKYLDFSHSKYLGIDVVDSVIESNKMKYAKENIDFKRMDASQEEIPIADLALCKDVLQHLDNGRAKTVIDKAARSRRLVLTNDYSPVNLPVELGGTRPINPVAAPFHLDAKPVLYFAGKVTFLAETAD